MSGTGTMGAVGVVGDRDHDASEELPEAAGRVCRAA